MDNCARCGQALSGRAVETPMGWLHEACATMPTDAGQPRLAASKDLIGFMLVGVPIVGGLLCFVMPAGVPVVVVTMAVVLASMALTWMDARRNELDAGLAVALVGLAWIIGYPLHLWRRSRVTTPLFLPGLASVLLFMAGAAYGSELGAKIDSQCSARGTGAASCSFVNLGIGPGSACVVVSLSLRGTGDSLQSTPVCSGKLMPAESRTVEGSFPVSPVAYCHTSSSNQLWTDACSFSVEPVRRFGGAL